MKSICDYVLFLGDIEGTVFIVGGQMGLNSYLVLGDDSSYVIKLEKTAANKNKNMMGYVHTS